MFTSCYLWQVCLHSYHRHIIVWLSLFQVYSSLQVQPGATPATAGLMLGNLRKDGNNAILPIVWSSNSTSGLDIIHPNWMALSFHPPTVQQLVSGEGGSYMLETFVIGWPRFWVAARRPLLRNVFTTTRPLPCWQEMCLKLPWIVFATMSLVNY